MDDSVTCRSPLLSPVESARYIEVVLWFLFPNRTLLTRLHGSARLGSPNTMLLHRLEPGHLWEPRNHIHRKLDRLERHQREVRRSICDVTVAMSDAEPGQLYISV